MATPNEHTNEDSVHRVERTVWEELDNEILVLDPDVGVVHRLAGDAAVAGRALLADGKVPESLESLATALVTGGIVPQLDLGGGGSRRAFLRRSGTAAAIAGVTTLVLPAAAAAASPSVPPPVENLQANNVTGLGATLTWSALSGAVNYTIEYRLTSVGDFVPLVGPPTTSSTSYVVNTLTPNTSYELRVVATLSDQLSSPSNVVSIFTMDIS